MTIYVLGLEPFNYGYVLGVHEKRSDAENQANFLESTKSRLCCQNYIALSKTEVKKRKLILYR